MPSFAALPSSTCGCRHVGTLPGSDSSVSSTSSRDFHSLCRRTRRCHAASLDLVRARDSLTTSVTTSIMTDDSAWGHLRPDGRTLSPLPPNLRSGLIAITVLSLVSFVASVTLFLYLSYKLILWRFFIRDHPARAEQHPARRNAAQPTTNFTLGIDDIFPPGEQGQPESADAQHEQGHQNERQPPPPPPPPLPPAPRSPPPNQFLVLIYNLFLADMHQSLAFLLNTAWLQQDGIIVRTTTCWAQGFFVSTGDLSSSMFIMAIAIHTYMSVVLNRRPSHLVLYIAVILVWVFVYAISLLPVAATKNGHASAGFFVRAGAWCWINQDYEELRLVTHYLFIFLALCVTSTLYLMIFISLRRQQSQARKEAGVDGTPVQLSHKPAFLIYPVIYVACTLPLALGRIATMAGLNVPIGYFCFAGGMIAFNGSFDCLLFGTTRNTIIFAAPSDLDNEDTGVTTIAFLQTPSRDFGNMVWIQGGSSRAHGMENETAGGWLSWHRLKNGGGSSWAKQPRQRNASQESLRGTAIQMDMVTTVVVEEEVEKSAQRRKYPEASLSEMTSMKSGERDFSDGER
ncbi:G-protein coupled receptor [Purpureocillium lavendulum]|uniref:G-protein coupled receptor n=1 Tax=Purpureocillium lavendulum TaxID=1247861 RepID=A0AB34FT04_9HYPO|nr:G-protein coupled receptor [Purpureocillium lavendulum]